MAKKPETSFRENSVLPFLKTLKNTHVFPIQQLTIRGTPDLLLCSSGIFVAAELKRSGPKPDPLQQWNLNEVKRTGGVALCISPDNWEQVKDLLRKLDSGEKCDYP